MFDIIAGIILAAFIINGLRKGFFHEAFGFIGLAGGILAGIIGARLFAGSAEKILPGALGQEPFSYLICFIAFFVAFMFLSKLVAAMFDKLSDTFMLGWLNKVMGSFLGGLKGALFIGLVLHSIAFLPFGKSFAKSQKKSILYRPLYQSVPMFYKLLGEPKNLPKKVEEIIKESTETLEDTGKDIKEGIDDLDRARDLIDGIKRD
jgi:uncharacterized membrane protein required for colicin V production